MTDYTASTIFSIQQPILRTITEQEVE